MDGDIEEIEQQFLNQIELLNQSPKPNNQAHPPPFPS